MGSSKAENSMPCTRCFMRTRVVFKTARFKQTALKLSWWIMHVIGSLFAPVKVDASAICLQHRHSRGWFNVVMCSANIYRVTNRPKTSSSLPWILAFTRITAFFAFFVFWLRIVRSNHKFLCRSHFETISDNALTSQKKTWRRTGDLKVKNKRSAFESWNETLTQNHRDC